MFGKKPRIRSAGPIKQIKALGGNRGLFVDPALEEAVKRGEMEPGRLQELKSTALSFITAPEVLIEGPAGTGKSFCVMQLVRQLCYQYKGLRVLFCRANRVDMNETVLELWEETVMGMDHPVIRGGASRPHRKHYEFPNGSRIVVGGLNAWQSVMSGRYDIICYFEAVDEQNEATWDALVTRLRGQHIPNPRGPVGVDGVLTDEARQMLGKVRPGMHTIWDLRDAGYFESGKKLDGGRWPDGRDVFSHMLIGDCNPGHPQHWLNLRASRLREDGSPQMRRLLSRHTDNPSVTKQYLDGLRNMQPEQRKRLFEGLWHAAEGQIFACYNPDIHVITVDPLERFDWYLGSIDWGYEDPGVFQVWGVNSSGMVRIVEIYFTKKNIAWWAEVVNDFNTKYQMKRIVADPSRPEYIDDINRKLAVEGANTRVYKAMNDIQVGLDALRYGLMPGEGHKPLVRFDRNAHRMGRDPLLEDAKRPCSWEDEAPAYTWDIWRPGKPYKDLPRPGQSDHAIDATRYAAVEVMKPGILPEEDINLIAPQPWQVEYVNKIRRMERRNRGRRDRRDHFTEMQRATGIELL